MATNGTRYNLLNLSYPQGSGCTVRQALVPAFDRSRRQGSRLEAATHPVVSEFKTQIFAAYLSSHLPIGCVSGDVFHAVPCDSSKILQIIINPKAYKASWDMGSQTH